MCAHRVPRWHRVAAALCAVALTATFAPMADAAERPQTRFATFNASLNRASEGQLATDLSTPDNPQAKVIAEIIQRANPDVVLVNEFDYDAAGTSARLFAENYLAKGQNGAEGIDYPYRFTAPVNTGVPSGMDLNNDGKVGGGDDAYGFGEFPGQYGMVVYSKHPIDTDGVRTFQNFLWTDMPNAMLPDDPSTPAPADWYSAEELAAFRLSSKSHWDLPIKINNSTVHFLTSHPTPPTFDGAEDRNGTRNHDEIRFWADYIAGGKQASYITDDNGGTGGLSRRDSFVLAGDQNSDPLDGDSVPGSIDQLLQSNRVNARKIPTSEGAVEAAELQGGVNADHKAPAKYDTADFAEPPGNIRADYVLPSRNLHVTDTRVFWPTSNDPLSRLTGTYPFPSSDHRLVWLDVTTKGRLR
ncbi:endonuclease/exonuclease/phosphatase family protein [Propionibacteriaceae bacterium Y1700]|uniref:endonuclease/exonuclease/phosphatase family protein n=1 Tax=Microlunatus sp. Y1700 TaxID=3418487 RepID=UPI003DA74CB2